ncbi:MAG: 2-hydroxychromene-2-carboxylate isomerase [Pseudomonas marincola]
MNEPIEFYLEFVSPFAYIAAKEIEKVGAKHGREVIWRPISLGHIWKVLGVVGPASVPQKLNYIMMDSARSAKLLGIPIAKPAVFPVDAKLARLVFYALNKTDKALAKKFAEGVCDLFWGQGKQITMPEHLVNLARSLGLDLEFLARAAEDQEAKAAMIEATKAAVESGAVGMPWFKVDDQVYWGADRISQIDQYLEDKAANG